MVPDESSIQYDAKEGGQFTKHPTARIHVLPSFGKASNRGDLRSQEGTTAESTIYSGVIIRPFAMVYAEAIVHSDTFIGDQAIVRELTSVGKNCIIGAGSIIENNCFIGDRVRIMTRVYICAFSIIGDDCFIGPGVLTTNDRYLGSGDPERRRRERRGPTLEPGVRLGAGVVTLPGVTIASGVVIGAGGIVTKSIMTPGVYVEYGARLDRLRDEV